MSSSEDGRNKKNDKPKWHLWTNTLCISSLSAYIFWSSKREQIGRSHEYWDLSNWKEQDLGIGWFPYM